MSGGACLATMTAYEIISISVGILALSMSFGTIVQGYLKNGYNRVTAEMMAREFFRYES